MTMNNGTKIWAAIGGLVIPTIGFAFWLGRLQGDVDLLKSRGEGQVKEATKEAITRIETKKREIEKELTKNQVKFIQPINTVIGTSSTQAPYKVPSGGNQSYEIPIDIPNGGKLISAWYVPIDNLGNLSGFQTIDVSISGKNRIKLTLASRSNAQALLRIVIQGVYISS